MSADLRQAALDYHANPVPGKIAIALTKPAETAYDLALAYSPGVAEPVREIAANPADAYRYTSKANLVAVITNGTAILGLGNLGPLASNRSWKEKRCYSNALLVSMRSISKLNTQIMPILSVLLRILPIRLVVLIWKILKRRNALKLKKH